MNHQKSYRIAYSAVTTQLFWLIRLSKTQRNAQMQFSSGKRRFRMQFRLLSRVLWCEYCRVTLCCCSTRLYFSVTCCSWRCIFHCKIRDEFTKRSSAAKIAARGKPNTRVFLSRKHPVTIFPKKKILGAGETGGGGGGHENEIPRSKRSTALSALSNHEPYHRKKPKITFENFFFKSQDVGRKNIFKNNFRAYFLWFCTGPNPFVESDHAGGGTFTE